MIGSKKGKLYFKLITVVAMIAAALFSYSALAAVPASQPSIVNTNATTINGVPIANASIARVADSLFTNINFSSDILTCVRSLPSLCSASNASLEENSMSEIRDFRASSEAKASETFKWHKRTLYQPQNRSLVGYWKLDGNDDNIKEEIA